jgi:membrane protein implicated in regulation of membrane protease activity
MEFAFLLPLTIGLIVVYRAWGSNHDIAHLAIIFAVASLLAGLLLSPWEVQIVLLILIGIVAKLLWQNFDDKNDFQDPKNTENKDANLHYRGISYE